MVLRARIFTIREEIKRGKARINPEVLKWNEKY
jgi:hypothetical protein